MIEYFDRSGRATAFCDYGKDVYLWDGQPAAFIHDETVFAYSGKPIGWITDGWLCDLAGARLLFEYDAVGGPAKPDRQKKTSPGTRGQKPQKPVRQDPGVRAALSQNWSDRAFAELI